MIYRIALGDWSGDGHNQEEVFLFEIPDQFTVEVMKESYQKSVAEFGFGCEHFADEYEDNSIRAEWAQSLIAAGIPEHCISVFNGEYYIESKDDMCGIIFFMIGRNIEGFTFEGVTSTFPLLVGTWNAPIADSVGYGLFYS